MGWESFYLNTLRERLKIKEENLNRINDFILKEDNPIIDNLLRIIEKVGCPIIGTSANRSGSTPKYDLPSIFQDLSREDIHLWIDAGRLPENPTSTVVDLTDPLKPILLRRGNVDIDKIFESMW